MDLMGDAPPSNRAAVFHASENPKKNCIGKGARHSSGARDRWSRTGIRGTETEYYRIVRGALRDETALTAGPDAWRKETK